VSEALAIRLSRHWPAIVVTIVALVFPFVIRNGLLDWTTLPTSALFTAVNLSLIAAVGAAAFNLITGYAGQLSMAHAALMMVGTVASGWAATRWHMHFLLVLPLSAISGAIAGILVSLPALRLRGLYFLLATIAFHYIASTLYHWILPGVFGFVGIVFPAPEIPLGFGYVWILNTDASWYWFLLPFTFVCVFIMARYVDSYEGRALHAIEARDKGAALLGINVARSKLIVFAVSSAFVAMSGAVSGYFLGARVEDSFPVSVVLNYAVMIVVGGFSSLAGGIVGSFFFYLVPLFITWLVANMPILSSSQMLQKNASSLNLAIFGMLIVAILVWRPAGLIGLFRKAR